MNASAHALSVDLMGKVASIPALVQAEFSSATADFSPWLMDKQSQQETDPNSVDFGFSFPGWYSDLNCACILLQVCFSKELSDPTCHLCGVRAFGHDYQGQHWQFSSLDSYQFEGGRLPSVTSQQQLKHVFNQIYTLFGYPAPLPR